MHSHWEGSYYIPPILRPSHTASPTTNNIAMTRNKIIVGQLRPSNILIITFIPNISSIFHIILPLYIPVFIPCQTLGKTEPSRIAPPGTNSFLIIQTTDGKQVCLRGIITVRFIADHPMDGIIATILVTIPPVADAAGTAEIATRAADTARKG